MHISSPMQTWSVHYLHSKHKNTQTHPQQQHVSNLFSSLVLHPLSTSPCPLDFLSNLLSQARAKRYKVKSLSIWWAIVLASPSHTNTHTHLYRRIPCLAIDHGFATAAGHLGVREFVSVCANFSQPNYLNQKCVFNSLSSCSSSDFNLNSFKI